MPKPKANTRRVFLRLDEDAADLLDQLAPSENKRGAYVSELLRRAAQSQQQQGTEAAYAAIGRQVVGLALELARSLPPLMSEGASSPVAGVETERGNGDE